MAVVGVVAGALLIPAAGTAAVKAVQEVLVTNTTDNPVPTKPVGTTPVEGSVAVNGPVQVATPERFAQSGHADRINVGGGWATGTVAVPTGKDLVVTSVSARSDSTTDGTVRAMYLTPDGTFNAPGALHIGFERESDAEGASYVLYEQTDVVAKDFVKLLFNGAWPSSGGALDYGMDWSINGYLIDE